MSETRKTVLYDRHAALGAKIVEFGGYLMPLQYPTGIVEEHLRTRKEAGLFDVSHMGRFAVRGADSLAFLQHALSNNAAGLAVGQAQYTMVPDLTGGAIDDAYLYRFDPDEYLLVVNAANRAKDWEHLQRLAALFDCELADRSGELAMLSLQGPRSREILAGLLQQGRLPEPSRNELSQAVLAGAPVRLARTGYTGEPVGFELFLAAESAPAAWDLLIRGGATPVGLGARDTLRLEAGLPLYGHELGQDPEGRPIPIFACPLARFAVSLSPLKGEFVGWAALGRQRRVYERIVYHDCSLAADLPRLVRPVAVLGKGVARAGAKVFVGPRHVGYVTSGTAVPYWRTEGQGLSSRLTDRRGLRSIALALLDCDLHVDQAVEVDIRGARVAAMIVREHLRSEAPPYARAVVYNRPEEVGEEAPAAATAPAKAGALLGRAIANHLWRQRRCVNLIPSEMTASPMARRLSILDPAFRYAEHKEIRALEREVFYYQGTEFIEQVETALGAELRAYLGCREVETRVISGQMANAAVFSAMADYLNCGDRRSEPRRIRCVMNNHILRGGHLSAQPMGALKDFVARDARTERPAIVNFPVLADNPYRIDVSAAARLIEQHRPELIVFGKSLVLHTEPVAEVRRVLDSLSLPAVVMYDAAHVLGLLGRHFQDPFAEGADLLTASTHKTFFGTQRGLIAADWPEDHERQALWGAVRRRTFPGSVSNHHLGTLLGLLMAAYEMNHFRDAYQRAVIANAKSFALSLKRSGLAIAGDPSVQYTQTHQVVLEVGYGRGPEMARRLEENNIVVNYQAGPGEEGFTAAGLLRMGVAEMTRFGMQEADFGELADLIADVLLRGQQVKDKVASLRQRFLDLRFCFSGSQFDIAMKRLGELV